MNLNPSRRKVITAMTLLLPPPFFRFNNNAANFHQNSGWPFFQPPFFRWQNKCLSLSVAIPNSEKCFWFTTFRMNKRTAMMMIKKGKKYLKAAYHQRTIANHLRQPLDWNASDNENHLFEEGQFNSIQFNVKNVGSRVFSWTMLHHILFILDRLPIRRSMNDR